jgi:PAS domain S-box-containing protein
MRDDVYAFENEERFRFLFEGHMAAMLLIEPDGGQILDANAAAARFYGYTREQLQAMCIQQINQLSPEDVAAQRRRAVDRTTNEFVFPHRLAGGEIRFVEVYSSPVTIRGRPTLFSIIHDVTSRKHAEEALERTRFTLAEAQKIAHLGSFEYDAVTGTTVWSEEEFRIYGLDPTGPSPAYDVMLAKCIHPDDAPLLHETFTGAMRSGWIYEMEHRIVLPDGSVRWVYDRAHPYVDENRDILRYVGATLDITERKQAEEALRESEEVFRAIFDQSKVGKVQVDPTTGRFLRVNEAFCTFTGYSAEELLGRTLFEITHPDDRAEDVAKLEALREGWSTSFESEKRYLRPDGGIVWGLVSVNLVRDAAGQARFTVGVVQDITARKAAEGALRESEAERAAHLERTRLARDLHDSVSQAIFAAALKAEALDIAAECVDDGIGPAARQVCRLCKGALADLRAMLLELRGERLEDIPLDQLLRQLVEATEGRTSARIGLAVEGSSTLPADVHVVFYRVAQEALNNVARHARAATVSVEVELSGAGGSLEVRDDGRGFELRDFGLEHLGIRTMRERASEVGADLDLTSVVGRGTCVTLRWRKHEPVGD